MFIFDLDVDPKDPALLPEWYDIENEDYEE